MAQEPKGLRDRRRQISADQESNFLEFKRGVCDRLGAIASELNSLKEHVEEANSRARKIDKKLATKIPTCSWHFNRARRHAIAIIAKLK
jgi:hypothetical protein